ncbi:MAG: hypothetical protein AB7U75_19685 [Hyphomicrobiaceae bacterium]
MKLQTVFAAMACALAATGLALVHGPSAAADAKKKASAPVKATQAEQAAISSGVLTQQEARLDCKRLAGQIQIRILEYRGGGAKGQSSGAAQGLQSAMVPIFGGSQHGADAAGDKSRDIAKLDAMNQILISRNCPHYDLATEMKMDQTARTPRLIRVKQQSGKKKP